MKHLANKVAVVTGAASGFGRELAILCATEGMRVVLADIDEAGLTHTHSLLPDGAQAIEVRCDVSSQESVDALAQASLAHFGAVHLLFNNAGVGTTGPLWSTTLDDWQWVLGINLMGVAHGIRSFVPAMLAAGEPCHVVNTASAAGLGAYEGSGVYCASKYGVVAISECLYHELQTHAPHVGVSVLCPAFVNTGIADAEDRRPAEFGERNPGAAPYAERARQAIRAGRLSAADIARITLDGVKAGKFYILTHPKIKASIETRMQDILLERTPTHIAG